MNNILQNLTNIVEPHNIRTGESAERFHIDERNRYTTAPLAVVLPETTKQVTQIIEFCAAQTPPINIIPQGGNTGLVGGCAILKEDVPIRDSILLNVSQLNQIIHIDPKNRTLTVQAGVTLEAAQQAAAVHGLTFPLTLASQSAATIGGNLATNAGGTQVLRYGNMRDLCLGLEVVLPNGELWNGLNTLRKNNTGYDLKHLFIGAEGTLGIITAAVLKLFPAPKHSSVALIAAKNMNGILSAFDDLSRTFDSQITAFEYISPNVMALVCEQFGFTPPFKDTQTHTALVEISSTNELISPLESLQTQIALLLEQSTLSDAVFAQNIKQSEQFWQMRELISAAQKRIGKNIKHDISVPISAIGAFIEATLTALEAKFPGIEPTVFGHIGDGNLHFNVSKGLAFIDAAALMNAETAVNAVVYEQVAHFKGSISAEHGIGLLKRDLMPTVKSAVELSIMCNIKTTLDPLNLMNPNKVFKTH